ncbi:MAG TPA: NAD-dependent epimerase/dehydratase family protein [Actinomycetota bacterium]|nr:NAD-dependent epimerase/dehydratase family protein [Actinomycetota bacterium]
MPRVLVTGGAGFVGANLVRHLLGRGFDVRVLDDLSTGRLDYLDGLPVEVREGSITDAGAVRRAVRGSDAIVHLAAMSGVAPSVAHPGRDFAINVEGTFNVLDAARRASVGRVVFASSGAVLAAARPPLHEELAPRPLAPYGASKLYGEAILQAFSTYGIVGVGLRFSNVYGPFCAHKRSVVAEFVRRVLGGRPLVIYGDGRQTRDFLHVDDVVVAVERAIRARRSALFQLGTGRETSIVSLARLVARVAGVPLEVERRPPRPGEASRNYTDVSRAARGLRWRPRVALEEGLAGTLTWMREHRRPG